MKRYRGVLLSLLGAVASPLVVSTHAGASPLRERGAAVGVVSDGDQWLVLSHAGEETAINTVTGMRRSFPVAAGCEARDVHRGLLLRVCPGVAPGGPSGTYVIRLRTGNVAAVPNAALSSGAAFGGPDPGWVGIGTQWLTGYLGCYHCEETTQYVNWHTGERRTSGSLLESDSVGLDTDDPKLRPVTRAGAPRRLRYPTYAKGSGALITTVGTRHVTLSRCSNGCSHPVVGTDRYAWTEGQTLRGYVASNAHRTMWKIPAAAGPIILGPFITRNRITILAGTRDAGGRIASNTAYTAGWPT